MPNNSHQLLVPIRVEALVIDDSIPEKAKLGGDGHWSPRGSNLHSALTQFLAPGPPPFLDAAPYSVPGTRHAAYYLKEKSLFLPQPADCGVYLHWVLPDGLRHAHGFPQNELAFPPLPDQWLVVRILRPFAHKDQPGARAWFVDGSLLLDKLPDKRLHEAEVVVPVDRGGQPFLAARLVGRSDPFPAVGAPSASSAGKRATITAAGSALTGSPTFSAYVPDNRNVLSFQDDLSDLRQNGRLPQGLIHSLSYLVLGWYHAESGPDGQLLEPLAYVRGKLSESDLAGGEKTAVLQALGWQYDGIELPPERPASVENAAARQQAEDELPADLLSRRCLFHGLLANVNYFDPNAYHGPLLGYPGSPWAHSEKTVSTAPNFKIGIGNNAADALIALVANASRAVGAGDDDHAALWKALEAVIYRQTRTLTQSWRESPREHAVHQSWFNSQDAGMLWTIADLERSPAADDMDSPAAPIARPKAEVLEIFYNDLEKLNAFQAEVNQAARDLTAWQQEYSARWWLLARSSFGNDGGPDRPSLEAQLDTLLGTADPIRVTLETNQTQVRNLYGSLRAGLNQVGLDLRQEMAPRFWQPSDPVIVVQNAGSQAKHEFPSTWLCRSEVPPSGDLHPVEGLETIKKAALTAFPPGSSLQALIDEAARIEQSVYNHAAGSAEAQPFADPDGWRGWMKTLQQTLEKDPTLLPGLVSLWDGQPWNPLFLDWQITWHPDEPPGTDFGAAWQFAEDANDYLPNPDSAPQGQGFELKGRSILAPQIGRVFSDPIDELRNLLNGERGHGLDPQAAGVLNSYLATWDLPLQELEKGGLLGQTLTGFHQVLLGRDGMLPRISPNQNYPRVREPEDPNDPDDPGSSAYNDQAVLSSGVLRPGNLISDACLFSLAQDGLPELKTGDRPPPELLAQFEEQNETLSAQARMRLDVAESQWAVVDARRTYLIRSEDKALNVYNAPQLLAGPRLAPPDPNPGLPFSLLRSGCFTVDALWMVDDFGQWWDLLKGSSAVGSEGMQISPHSAWPGDRSGRLIAQPPRILQPASLNFRFVSADFGTESGGHPGSDPVCGWVFHNYLDQALTLCSAEGSLLGELVLVEEPGGDRSVRWESLRAVSDGDEAGVGSVKDIPDLTLRAFAQALVSEGPAAQTKLQALLALINDSLGTIRPSTSSQRFRLAGRPLALVNARIGLELFGQAWTDPLAEPLADPAPSAPPGLEDLRVPVRLGCAPLVEDGLIGYFKRSEDNDDDMGHIVVVRQPQAGYQVTQLALEDLQAQAVPEDVLNHLEGLTGKIVQDREVFLALLRSTIGNEAAFQYKSLILKFAAHDFVDSSGYLSDGTPLEDAVRVGFGRAGSEGWQRLTLLMDPNGAVHASVGLLPAKSLTLPRVYLERARENMELSFRVAPLLTRKQAQPFKTIQFPVTLPVGWQGRWGFERSQDATPLEVLPPDDRPDYTSLLLALEGRLVLRKDKDGG